MLHLLKLDHNQLNLKWKEFDNKDIAKEYLIVGQFFFWIKDYNVF